MHEYIIPLLLSTFAVIALRKQENAYDILTDGAAEGFHLLKNIAPPLVILLSAISMLRASGALDAAGNILSPVFSILQIPPETSLLILVRPISGSAALAIGTELIFSHGPDSLIGRTAAVMLGSTETTFYVISVYFGACGIRKTRYAVPAALIADFTGFLSAAWTARMFL